VTSKVLLLSPTSWQPLFIATAISSLMSLQVCQHTNMKTIYSCIPYVNFLLSHLPFVSKYQNTALHFILLMPTAHIFCVRQYFEKKSQIEAVHYMPIELK
jgi:tryptophan-rich sensory protein